MEDVKIIDLKQKDFYDYAIKHAQTKTETIMEMVDKNYQSHSQLLEKLLQMKVENPTYKKLCGTSRKSNATSIRKLAEITLAEETKQKAKKIGLSSSNELFGPFSQLEVEAQLFEMFGDIDTAVNLRMQQLMVCTAINDVPNIVYWHSHEDACDSCKNMHDSCLPWVYEFIRNFREHYTHFNCDDDLLPYAPMPCEYLPRKHPANISGTATLDDLFNSLFGTLSSTIHTILDIVGFIPIVGNIADGINAVFYALEGDYENAGLSLISAIPFVGWISGGVKMTKVGVELTLKMQKQTKLVKRINESAEISNRLKKTTIAIDGNGKISEYIDKISKTSHFINNSNKYKKLASRLEKEIITANKSNELNKNVLKSIKDLNSVSKTNSKIVKTKKIHDFAKVNDFLKIFSNDKTAKIIKEKASGEDFSQQIEKVISQDAKLKKTIEMADNAKFHLKYVNNLPKSGKNDIIKNKRPTHKQSEKDVAKDNPGALEQVSYLDGKVVPYGTKGSVRPDLVKGNVAIEVKNYNIQNKQGVYRLLYNVNKQIAKREIHLPKGMKQRLVIDVRGQNVPDDNIRLIYEGLNKNIKVLIKRS